MSPLTSTAIEDTAGLISTATSTIGNGTATGGLTVNGTATTTNLINLNVTSAAALYDANHKEGAYTGTTCTNQALTALNASISGTCASITDSFFSGQLGLAHGGTNASLSGANQVVFINSGNTALTSSSGLTYDCTKQKATYASTNELTSGTNTFFVNSSGEISGKDVGNGWSGQLTQSKPLWFPWATTSPWTGTTTGAFAVVDTYMAPWNGTIQAITCTASTSRSFLGINVFINHTAITPSYFVASSTVGTTTPSANNAFHQGDTIGMNVGTTTQDVNALGGGCILYLTQTT